jgi:5-methylcytosine-specific restriction endonuclease McrA
MRLYDTSWHVVRNAFLRSKPLCEQCGAPAEIAHHVVPLKEGGARLDPENLMALCVPCHGKIHGGKG